MSARSKRLLEMALGVETDIINTARFPLDNNTSEKECPVYDGIDNNSVSMIYDTDSTSSSCMSQNFSKTKTGVYGNPRQILKKQIFMFVLESNPMCCLLQTFILEVS
nr:unnamed protein product [Callosobruchus analis]